MPYLLAVLSMVTILQTGRRLSWLGRGPREGEAEFVPVPDLERLDHLIAESNEGAVVLFLHDPYCPISARAYQQMSQAGGQIHQINVSRQHDLNRAIETRTGVRHESPQAIVLRNEKPVWYASHGAITTEGLVTARER